MPEQASILYLLASTCWPKGLRGFIIDISCFLSHIHKFFGLKGTTIQRNFKMSRPDLNDCLRTSILIFCEVFCSQLRHFLYGIGVVVGDTTIFKAKRFYRWT